MLKKTAHPAAGHQGSMEEGNLSVSQKPEKCNIPQSVIVNLENELRDLKHGGISLIVAVRDGNPSYRIEKTVSLLPGGQL